MRKTFEIIAGIIILTFMAVVLWQIISHSKTSQLPTNIRISQEESVKGNNLVKIISPATNEEIIVPSINNEIEFNSYIRPLVVWQAEETLVDCNYKVSLLSQDEESVLGSGTLSIQQVVDGLIINEDTYDPTKYYYSGEYELVVTVTCPNGHAAEGVFRDSSKVFYTLQEIIEPKSISCTADAKMCPDGSFVGRVGPDCEFAECPSTEFPINYGSDADNFDKYRADCESKGGTFNECGSVCNKNNDSNLNCVTVCSAVCEAPVTTEPDPVTIVCSQWNRDDSVECAEIYSPVCGQVQVECVTTPCNPVPETFSNSCYACANERVLSYTEGACESGQ